jgi:hypothetical protein
MSRILVLAGDGSVMGRQAPRVPHGSDDSGGTDVHVLDD